MTYTAYTFNDRIVPRLPVFPPPPKRTKNNLAIAISIEQPMTFSFNFGRYLPRQIQKKYP